MRTGARHLAAPAIRVDVPSPFDYARLARVFVVTDVGRGDIDRVAAAYRALMQASGGGALGLFTAIARLRAVHDRIAADMEKAGLALLAQHVDGLDTTSLVDIFRAETDSCMLGTDAMRDGVDVPGRSLRLIVFDRLPWPRPTILPSRTPQGVPGHPLRRHAGPAPSQAGLRPAGAPGRRPRRVRPARPEDAVSA